MAIVANKSLCFAVRGEPLQEIFDLKVIIFEVAAHNETLWRIRHDYILPLLDNQPGTPLVPGEIIGASAQHTFPAFRLKERMRGQVSRLGDSRRALAQKAQQIQHLL